MDTNSTSVTPVAADWQPAPMAAEDYTWLASSDEKRSIFRDLREILRGELWPYRGLAYELMRRDIRVRYKQTALGFAWAVFMPSLIVLAGATMRYAMAHSAGRQLGIDALAGIAIKALPWSFFVGSMGFATTSLVAQSNLVTKIYFPRELLPLSATMAQAFDSSVGATTLFIAFALLGVGVDYRIALAWGPLLALLVFLFTAGLGLLTSCANLFFRDVKYIVQVCLTFGIFFTPVFYEPEVFGGFGARLMMLNPLAPLLEGLRLSVVMDHNLLETLVVEGRRGMVLAWSPWYLAYSAAWALATFLSGLVLFHRAESRFAEFV